MKYVILFLVIILSVSALLEINLKKPNIDLPLIAGKSFFIYNELHSCAVIIGLNWVIYFDSGGPLSGLVTPIELWLGRRRGTRTVIRMNDFQMQNTNSSMCSIWCLVFFVQSAIGGALVVLESTGCETYVSPIL